MKNKIMVECSARHIHLSNADLEALFGKGYQLTNKKNLSQPGQFACAEKVTVETDNGSLKMSILGPTRKDTQVEVSFSDARSLKIVPPVRESGNIEGTPGCRITGPEGTITIDKGVIVAKRHIHLTPDIAKEYGVEDKQVVSVKVDSDERSTTFHDVVVRVNESYAPAMHIDTDEANAAGYVLGMEGEIIK